MSGGKSSAAGHKNKNKKSQTKIQKVFRRVQSKPDSLEMVGAPASGSAGALFAQPLAKICSGDKLPQPIMDMLLELRSKGTHTKYRRKDFSEF